MELRHLRYFVAVAEADGGSRANAAHITTFASWQIRDLEDEVGARLLSSNVCRYRSSKR